MSDERRKEAEAWAAARVPPQLRHVKWTRDDAVDGYLAGDEAGARREREEIVRWIRAEYCYFNDERGFLNNYGFVDAAAIAIAVERGEHRGGE